MSIQPALAGNVVSLANTARALCDIGEWYSGFPSRGPYATHPWNLNNIARLPRSVIGSLKSGISGVTVPWVNHQTNGSVCSGR